MPRRFHRFQTRRLAVLSGTWALIPLIACGGSARRASTASTPQADTAAAATIPGYNLRVVLDSGELQIETTPKASAVTVISPAGTFLEVFRTNAPFVAWANSIERLLPNARAGATGTGANARDTVIDVPAEDQKYPTHFWFERTSGASPSYSLAGTNGAWSFTLALDSAQVTAVAAALRGELASGVQRFDLPHQGRTPAEAIPLVTGAWLGLQVDQPAATLGGPVTFRYPSGFRGRGSTVTLGFIVDSTGFVRTSSISLIGNPPAPLALSAREQLAAMRFRPAMRLGRAVPQMIVQEIRFAW
jgi:hypothetical protein